MLLMNVPFRKHIIMQLPLVTFQFLPSLCKDNSHHIALTSAIYLIPPPFPPQVQVRPVTPVTSICQVSWSRLHIWHDLFLEYFFFSFNSFLFFFFLPSLVSPSPSNPSYVNAISSQEAEFEMTALKLCHHSKQTSTSGLTLNVFSFCFVLFVLGCSFVSVL